MTKALKLRAADEEDLAVVSTILQDAIAAVADIAFLAGERRFVFVVNRYRWEGGERMRERILSGVRFDGVDAVKKRGFARSERDRILELLALRAVAGGVLVEFAGGPSIRLETARIDCRIDDLGEPWPTQWRPDHKAAGA